MSVLKNLTRTPQPGRPLWKRATLVGGAMIAVAQYLEQTGQAPEGTYAALNQTKDAALVLANCAGGLLALFGLYRHIPSTD